MVVNIIFRHFDASYEQTSTSCEVTEEERLKDARRISCIFENLGIFENVMTLAPLLCAEVLHELQENKKTNIWELFLLKYQILKIRKCCKLCVLSF